MTDAPKRSTWPIVASVLLLVSIVYVFSIGPAVWLYMSGSISWEAYARIYVPLINAARYCRLAEWLDWYLIYWGWPPG